MTAAIVVIGFIATVLALAIRVAEFARHVRRSRRGMTEPDVRLALYGRRGGGPR